MLIEQIRSATAVEHKKLEDRLFPFLNNIQSNEQYAQLLNAFYGYIFPVQEKIAAFIDHSVVPDMNERRNAAYIAADLETLNLPLAGSFAETLPDIHDHASAMGALYVLEGSTLGGKIIAKTISEKIEPTEAFRFFRGYGPETGPMWKKFTQYIEHPLNQLNAKTVVNTATETFRCFGISFENQLT
jgi:heme oxygenase (biliverdin-IX-beta and delta-forming)